MLVHKVPRDPDLPTANRRPLSGPCSCSTSNKSHYFRQQRYTLIHKGHFDCKVSWNLWLSLAAFGT